MKQHYIKLLCFLFTAFLLTGCKESVDAPPFNLFLTIKLINENGSSPLKENRDKVGDIKVNLIKPINDTAKSSILYLDYYDCLRIQVVDWSVTSKNGGNFEQEYIMEIQYHEKIRQETDILKFKIRFENARPFIIESFYNNETPQYMGLDVVSFEINN